MDLSEEADASHFKAALEAAGKDRGVDGVLGDLLAQGGARLLCGGRGAGRGQKNHRQTPALLLDGRQQLSSRHAAF